MSFIIRVEVEDVTRQLMPWQCEVRDWVGAGLPVWWLVGSNQNVFSCYSYSINVVISLLTGSQDQAQAELYELYRLLPA